MDTVYVTKSGCSHCTVVINFLNSRPALAQKVSVRYIDSDDGARRDFEALGFRSRPAAVIRGQKLVGDAVIINAIRAAYGTV